MREEQYPDQISDSQLLGKESDTWRELSSQIFVNYLIVVTLPEILRGL
jgi:hypothetical protein